MCIFCKTKDQKVSGEANKAIDIESGDTEVHIDTGEPKYDIVALAIVSVLIGLVIIGVLFI